jgi:hypothetical protein
VKADKQHTKPGHPTCPECGEPATHATGAQQFRKVAGIRRLHAHLLDNRGHEWWDRSAQARDMAREADRQRKAHAAHEREHDTPDGR